MSIGSFINDLFNKYMIVRRLLVAWALFLITAVVFKMLSIMTTLDTPTAAAISTVVGILATVTGFYLRSRELDAKREFERDMDDSP